MGNDTQSFHERLASLCGPEIAAAMRDDDTERASGMIAALAAILGRTVARAAKGDPATVDQILTGAEQLMAEEASGMAGFIGLAKLVRRK